VPVFINLLFCVSFRVITPPSWSVRVRSRPMASFQIFSSGVISGRNISWRSCRRFRWGTVHDKATSGPFASAVSIIGVIVYVKPIAAVARATSK